MISNVKKQHYVWQHYLKAWTNDKKIFCKRGNGIFHTSTENIAQERYFYELEPLNNSEKLIIEKMIKKFHPSSYELLKSTFDVYLEISEGDEDLRLNGLELFHSSIEDKAVPLINSIRENKLNVLDDKQNKIDFCRFIGRQYTRTKKIKEIKLETSYSNSASDKNKDYDLNKISKVISFLMGDKIGSWIYSFGVFNFLTNSTAINFITGDQPVYNLLAKENEEPVEFELYYPISPKIALLISKEKINSNIDDVETISKYNEFIKSISYENLFAISKEELC